jgi:hypothetical protein
LHTSRNPPPNFVHHLNPVSLIFSHLLMEWYTYSTCIWNSTPMAPPLWPRWSSPWTGTLFRLPARVVPHCGRSRGRSLSLSSFEAAATTFDWRRLGSNTRITAR